MARLSLSLDKRTVKNGMMPIRLRINHKGTSAYVGTGVEVEEQYFNAGSLYDPIHRKAYMAAEKRDKLSRFVRQFDEFLADVDLSELSRMTANNIKERVCGQVPVAAHTYAREASDTDFVEFFETYGESRRTDKTRESYAYAAKVLRLYCAARGLRTLMFYDIDYARLVDFARWLSETKSPATRHMFASYVRAAYRDGQKRRLVSRDHDPYYDYSITPVPLKDIECMTAKQMKQLMMYETKLAGLQMGRDVALMSFYLCGHNLIDLYEMGLPNNGVCEFVRHKIEHRYQREVKIRIEPELKALVEKYQGDWMLLKFKATYPNYDGFRHKIAHRLRDLSADIGFEVSMPKIRRTWATIAAELDCPDDVINKSMGHVDKTVNDRSYKEYKWKKTAKWNRKIINYIKSIKL